MGFASYYLAILTYLVNIYCQSTFISFFIGNIISCLVFLSTDLKIFAFYILGVTRKNPRIPLSDLQGMNTLNEKNQQ